MQRAKTRLEQFHPIQRTVKVSTGSHGFGKDYASGINSFPNPFDMTSSGDLLD